MTGSITDPDVVLRATQDVTSVIHIAGLVSYGTFPDTKGMENVNVNGGYPTLPCCHYHFPHHNDIPPTFVP